jgi:sulfate permease, SulP family
MSDLVSGTIVGIVALPLAIAFAIASGVPPEVGLITAVVAGFLISFLGGSRVQIGGPSGAFIIVIAGVAARFGMEGVVVVSVMAGIMLVVMGLLKAGSVIQFTPYPIVVGFTSGTAEKPRWPAWSMPWYCWVSLYSWDAWP